MTEPEKEEFGRIIVVRQAVVGTPTLVETRLVLSSRMDQADAFLDGFLRQREVQALAFSMSMYRLATEAFVRFGKGKGHRAQLNFGDCLAYAVAKETGAPLLYKGDDFARTDIRSARRQG